MKRQYEDTDFDKSLKTLNANLMWKSEQKQELKNRIITDIEKLESKERKKKPFLSTRIKKESLIRKLTYSSIALVILVSLFIGSAFISPAMAEVASKIPYLNLVFESEQKPVIDEIKEALDDKGYKWDGLGVVVRPREVSVMIIGTDNYYNRVKPEVENLIKDILKARDYNAYNVNVSKALVMEEQTSEEKKGSEQNQKILKIVGEVLRKYGYNSTGPGIRNKRINFDLPKTESKIEEIKIQVRDELKQNGFGEFSIKVYTFNPQKREREGRWMPIINTISDGLTAKAEYKVKLVGYTNKFDYLPISIETTLSAADEDTEKIVDAIEDTVQDYLESENVKNSIKNDQFEINIYSENGKKLN